MPPVLKWLVWLCVAVVIFTACTPAAADHFSAVLAPLGLVVLTIGSVVLRREAHRCVEQPVALLSLLLSRAGARRPKRTVDHRQ